ncbi:MAG: DUF3791 domain-containing protein [Atopobiaceae bacterium]|nr:DUF3791 domain-containing protein [Atopobiaceae bacterium]
MLDEVLYMQVRLFRMFREHTGLSSVASNEVFNKGGVWDFIASCYDYLHLGSDGAALDDVLARLEYLGVTW